MKELKKRITSAGLCLTLLLATTATACNNQKKAADSMMLDRGGITLPEIDTGTPLNDRNHSSTESLGPNAGVSKAFADILGDTSNSTNGETEDEEPQGIEQRVDNPVRHAAPPTIIPTEKVSVQEPAPMEPEVCYVSTWSLNVREQPGTEYPVIGYQLYGAEVTITSIKQDAAGNDWGEIQTEAGKDGIGYISMDYISKEPLIEYLGEFVVTYYCPCPHCCGRWSKYGKTASGTAPTEGRTIATDPSIPFGTLLIVNGREYVVEDRGSGINGNRIDIYLDNHNECFEHEVKAVPVFKEL